MILLNFEDGENLQNLKGILDSTKEFSSKIFLNNINKFGNCICLESLVGFKKFLLWISQFKNLLDVPITL